MAAIEKVCELGGEYLGYEMYGIKRNSIQVTPEKKKLFKNKKAVLFVFKPDIKTGIKYNRVERYKSNDILTHYINNQRYWALDHWPVWIKGKPKFYTEWTYCLYVKELQGDVEGCFWNWSRELGTVKRKLKNLVNSKLKIININMTEEEFRTKYSHEDQVLFFQLYYNKI